MSVRADDRSIGAEAVTPATVADHDDTWLASWELLQEVGLDD